MTMRVILTVLMLILVNVIWTMLNDEMVYDRLMAVNHDYMLLRRFSMYLITLSLTTKNRRVRFYKLN
jgi:hypothetical protein